MLSSHINYLEPDISYSVGDFFECIKKHILKQYWIWKAFCPSKKFLLLKHFKTFRLRFFEKMFEKWKCCLESRWWWQAALKWFQRCLVGADMNYSNKTLPDTYHWKYPTSNSTLMYLLGTVCCQHIHRSRIPCWVLICTLWKGLNILILALGFELSGHLCQKPNMEYKFDVPYFQWYVSMTVKYNFSNAFLILGILSFVFSKLRSWVFTKNFSQSPEPGNVECTGSNLSTKVKLH